MQNSYYPTQNTAPPYQNIIPQTPTTPRPIQPPTEYAENILELNVGKYANFYLSYSDSLEWRDKVFSGIIEAAGRDFAIIYNQETGKRSLLWTVYLNYVEFLEPIILKQNQG